MSKERTYNVKFNKTDRKPLFTILYYICFIVVLSNIGIIIHSVSWYFYGFGYETYSYIFGVSYGMAYIFAFFGRVFTSSMIIIVLYFLMRYLKKEAELRGVWEDLKALKKETFDDE